MLPGTVAANIMEIFTLKQLPVLSTLAREYAVCDYWFSSVPTMTLPNRAFASAGSCQGQMFDEKDSKHTGCYIEVPSKPKKPGVASIFGMLEACGKHWRMYHGGGTCQAVTMFADTMKSQGEGKKNKPLGVQHSTDSRKLAANLEQDVRSNDLPEYTFIEPDFGIHGNCQHPNYNVDRGELLIKAVYDALRSDPEVWKQTLFIITYDEHGGCYDHVWPWPHPQLKPPNDGYTDLSTKHQPFDFTRFGVRVPAVLVSPLIEPRTVCRQFDNGNPPFDHTSILRTIEDQWHLPPLTERDAAASSVGHVLTRDPSNARTDNPLQTVVVPSAPDCHPGATGLSHLQQVHAEYIAQLPIPDRLGNTHHVMPALQTEDEYNEYIRLRMAQWEANQRSLVP
ncbi:alkaline phosphatase family protein [Ktedonospora formicarum]